MAQLKGGGARGIASNGGTRGGGVITGVAELDPPPFAESENQGWPNMAKLDQAS